MIISLKRFKTSRSSKYGFGGGQKLDTHVDFPLEGLDMAPFVLSKKQKSAPLIYDLFAVSNHFGSVGFGHYTAFGKNPLTNTWYNFDDSSCSPISNSLGKKEIVSNAAYSLFYRLQRHQNQDEINFEEIE
jgi:ubiquitin carboxyl-terminal hydrolase 4/11/15